MRWSLILVAALVLTAACGNDGKQPADQVDPPRVDPPAAQPAAEQSSPRPDDGKVMQHPEAGFSVYWPAGCERLRQQESDGATRMAEREVITSCVRSDLGFTVRYLQNAHGAEGQPPHPRLVVALVEQQLDRKNLRTVRQRPLDSGRVQGVDVQAEGRDSQQRAWIRGLLVGTDVYLIMVLGEQADLFERAEVQDFFYSFNLDPAD